MAEMQQLQLTASKLLAAALCLRSDLHNDDDTTDDKGI